MWSIILEKLSGEESFWNPYFKVLPDQIYLPSIWKEEDLELLDGTGMDLMIPDSSDQFRKYFLSVKGSFPQTANISDKELESLFHYAGCLISAYSFCEDPDREPDIALVPFADTLNHRTGFNNARLYFEKEHLKMVCHADCPKGEQLFNTYGDLSNRDLLIKYGFADDPNPHHTVVFDPIEWLRDHVQQSKIGGESKRVCDSDPSAFGLFDKFDGKLPCELKNCSADGMKPLIDWIYLLSLPSKTPPSSLKIRSNYDEFLAVPENKIGVLNILKSRRSLLPASKVDTNSWNSGPKLYAQIIKNQDIEILDGSISLLESK